MARLVEVRAVRFVILAISVHWSAQSLLGMDPDVRRILPPDTAVVVEFQQALRVLDTALARDLGERLLASPGVRNALASPDVDRLRQAGAFLGKSLGTDWRTAFQRITAGGVIIAIHKSPAGNEPDVTLVMSSADDATLNRFVEAIRAEIERRTQTEPESSKEGKGKREKLARMAPRSYRGFVCHQVGNGHFAVAGRRLIAANRQSGLEQALDRLENPQTVPAFSPPESLRLDDEGAEPVVRVTLNLGLIRNDPKTAEALRLPGTDPAALLLLGGYFDLIRRSEFAAAGLFVDDAGCEVRIRIPAGTDSRNPDLAGFFAGERDMAAPLLRPKGTIATGSWYRDLARLWESRSKLLTPAVVHDLDAGNAQQQSQTGGVGLADLIQTLGPHLRVVVARQQEVVYRTPLPERLPALALTIDLANEPRFRDQILAPLERLVSGIVLSISGEVKTSDHLGARVSSIRFAESDPPVEPSQRGIYNFHPAWTIVRGHFVVGSTAEIVRDLVGELENAALAEPPPDASVPRVTSGVDVSFEELIAALRPYQTDILQSLATNHGLTPAQAGEELSVLEGIVRRISEATLRHVIGPDQFDIRIRVGRMAEQP